MSEKHHIIPVWFFVGLLVLIYGLLILGSGIVEWSEPTHVTLGHLRAPVWWGALLVVIGGFYVAAFRPGKD